VVSFTPLPLYSRGKGSRYPLDDVEKRKFLTLPGLELGPLDRLACRYSACAILALDLLTDINYFRELSPSFRPWITSIYLTVELVCVVREDCGGRGLNQATGHSGGDFF
jgi:hypothetical protein